MESMEKGVGSEVARHIAGTATRLFAAQGYDATSVRMIVEAAGVTKPTLYYHFGSKEGLAHALLNLPLSGLVERLEEIAREEGDAVVVLERQFEAHFAFCREEPDRARFYYAICFGPLMTGLAGELMKFGGKLDKPLEKVIGRLVEGGVVEGCRAKELLWTCRGLITSAVMEFLYQCQDGDLGPAPAHRLVGDLLWGYGIPGSVERGARE